ncbi:MAG: UvrD-helicase domain-containing protein, partial [Bacteroidales bacterium]|nr:UvrD-helicase domain-containing protein [Bacteroidales bacterium]
MDKLKIYKASAGSGKTFKLTEEYLKLVYANPYAYKQILAVTFTNKSTAEMKNRILQELYLLSINDASDKNIKQSEHKISLSKFFNLSDTEIRNKAKSILNNILHDYSKFSVNTIDKFFQQILRSFTKEIGIQPGYQIELNSDEILGNSIDELMNEIGDNAQLQEWLVKYSESKISEGKNWDFKKNLESLGKQIFTEKYKELNQDFIENADKELFNKYLKDLNSIKHEFENKLIKIGNEAIQYISSIGLEISDFSYGKSGVMNFFNKLSNKIFDTPGKRVLDAQESVDNWYKKTSTKKDEIENAVNTKLLSLLKDAVNHFNNEVANYNTATSILKNFYTLGILKDISRKIKEYSKRNNVFLLSDGAKLLNDIINNNDAPFIYEKVGNIYKHFLIDEFQDTSTMQWGNFKPLITNSLSQAKKNIIVGDIKQSIYRWRNSDWSILAHKVNNDFKQFLPKTEALEYNYRSEKNIINYNNTIFAYAASILQNDFINKIESVKDISENLKTEISFAYSDLYQKAPSKTNKNGGYISHKFYA